MRLGGRGDRVPATTMGEPALTLVAIGGFMLLGLLTDLLGRHTPLPRVTLLLLAGVVIGPAVLDLLPDHRTTWYPVVANTTLVMVGFLLGSALTISKLRRHGRAVLWLSTIVVLGTAFVVGLGLLALGVPLVVALALAGIATATDPAATLDVIEEAGARGTFSTTLRGIVAADDAWGLIAFSLILSSLGLFDGDGAVRVLLHCARDIGGAVVVGAALGVPMAYISGRIRPGEPTMVEALGLVLLCGGIALWLDVSFLLASMVMGFVVANLARHHTRPFHAIREVEWPFLVLFFLLSGAALRVDHLSAAGVVGAAYVLLRIAGRLVGAHVGGVIAGSAGPVRRWVGVALLPQAGVAVGMALVAAERYPEHAETLLSVTIGATVLFELTGPIATRLALRRVGEASVEAVR